MRAAFLLIAASTPGATHGITVHATGRSSFANGAHAPASRKNGASEGGVRDLAGSCSAVDRGIDVGVVAAAARGDFTASGWAAPVVNMS